MVQVPHKQVAYTMIQSICLEGGTISAWFDEMTMTLRLRVKRPEGREYIEVCVGDIPNLSTWERTLACVSDKSGICPLDEGSWVDLYQMAKAHGKLTILS